MSSSAAAHETLTRPGNSWPTAKQIIQDEGLEGKWAEKTILITGCSSGIGVETARTLALTGATLYLTARDVPKAKDALGDLLELDRVNLLTLNLESLESVRSCAAEFLSKSKSLNILILNAGVMAAPEGQTKDGYEIQFGTNHLAHFRLLLLLKPTLLASSTPEFNSRVVVLSSSTHKGSEVNFENINLKGEYDPWKAYSQSKTANIWMANEIERRHASQGLHAYSVHPGIIKTDLLRHLPEEHVKAGFQDPKNLAMMKSPEQGAATTVWAAVAKELEGKGGKFLEDCQIAKPAAPSATYLDGGYASWAYNSEKEAKLWSVSLELLGITDDS